MADGKPFGAQTEFFRGSLDKAIQFLFPAAGAVAGGTESSAKERFEKEKQTMRRLTAMMMALCLVLSLSAAAFAAEGEELLPAPDFTDVDTSAIEGVDDGVFTVGMECAYAPYNWTQMDDSNGAVPIVNNPGAYANGYDVMMAQRICDAYGWELEVMAIGWDGLNPALSAGTLDAVIAGQSMTETRLQEVDMAGPYIYASIVCVTKADSDFANAQGLSDLAGGTCTAQTGTIWYDTCLPQIEGAEMMPEAETAPAMIMAVESGTVDFICTDMPTALGAVSTYDDLTILDFSGSDDDFDVSEEEVNIGISVLKGNTELLDAINAVVGDLDADQFNALMDQAISVQPEI